MNSKPIAERRRPLLAGVMPALQRARKRAEEIARATNTALIYSEGGRIRRVDPNRLKAR